MIQCDKCGKIHGTIEEAQKGYKMADGGIVKGISKASVVPVCQCALDVGTKNMQKIESIHQDRLSMKASMDNYKNKRSKSDFTNEDDYSKFRAYEVVIESNARDIHELQKDLMVSKEHIATLEEKVSYLTWFAFLASLALLFLVLY